MNTLAYGLLSLLSSEPVSGYDLTARIKMFWHTNHSAVYPILTELEDLGYVSYELVLQTGKPDKKIYSLTQEGKKILKNWLTKELDPALKKDELTMRCFSLRLLDQDELEELLKQIEARCIKKLERHKKSLEDLCKKNPEGFKNLKSPKIGSFLLLHKGIQETQLELNWCQWIRTLQGTNFEEGIIPPEFFLSSDA